MKLYMIAYENQDDDPSTDWFFTVSEEPLEWDKARKKAIEYLMSEWDYSFESASKAVTEVYVNTIDEVDGYKVTLERTEK